MTPLVWRSDNGVLMAEAGGVAFYLRPSHPAAEGWWEAQFEAPNGYRSTTDFSSKEDAEEWLNGWATAIRTQVEKALEAAKPSVSVEALLEVTEIRHYQTLKPIQADAERFEAALRAILAQETARTMHYIATRALNEKES